MKSVGNAVTVVTHNGVFHADDTICVSLLRLYYGKENVRVIRSRNPIDFENADYILDVGRKREVTDKHVWFDHHQDITEYPNGVRRSACGYLFDYMIENGMILDETLAEQFRIRVLYPVEAQDNGQDLVEGLDLMPNLFTFITYMNPNWNTISSGDKEFLQAVNITDTIIERVIDRIKCTDEEVKLTLDAIEHSSDGIAELEQFCHWQPTVIDYNYKNNGKIKFVMWFDYRSNQYMAQGVPLSPKTKDTQASFPENMRGKEDKDINEIADTKTAVFVHPSGFLGGWKDREELLKVLHNILS